MHRYCEHVKCGQITLNHTEPPTILNHFDAIRLLIDASSNSEFLKIFIYTYFENHKEDS